MGNGYTWTHAALGGGKHAQSGFYIVIRDCFLVKCIRKNMRRRTGTRLGGDTFCRKRDRRYPLWSGDVNAENHAAVPVDWQMR